MVTVFRRLCLLLPALFLLHCATSPGVKSTSPQADPQLVAPLLRAAAKWAEGPELRAKLLQLADANGSIKKNIRTHQELNALYESGGRDAVRKRAIENGFYIPPEGVEPFGLFALVRKSPGSFTVKPVAVVGSLPANGLVAVDQVDDKLFLILSVSGFEKPEAYAPAALAELRTDLARDWFEAITLLSNYLEAVVPQTRYQNECASGGAYDAYLRDSVGTAFAVYNARKLEGAGMGEKVSLLSRDLIRHVSACPFVLAALVGPLISPVKGFGQSDVLYAAHIAFLGRLGFLCRGAEGTFYLGALAPCAWDRLLTSDAAAYRQLFETLGSTSGDWFLGLGFLVEQSAKMEPDARQLIAQKALSLGLIRGVWLDVLGFKISDLPPSITVEVQTLGIYSDGKTYEDEKTVATYEFPDVPLPVMVAAWETRLVDSCRVPLYWEDEWWRVCPPPDVPAAPEVPEVPEVPQAAEAAETLEEAPEPE